MASPLAQALDLLGIHDDEALSTGSQAPGGAFKGSRRLASDLRRARFNRDRNFWTGLCPVPAQGNGRGTAAEVLRVPALWADLDVKAGGMPSGDAARAVVADLSAMLGSEPAYVTMTGHGLQPVWSIDEADSHDVARARALLTRWGLLVRRVARTHGGNRDGVFDLARVLRAPGSTNVKDPAAPVPTEWAPAGGRPLSWDEIAEALDAYSVPDVAGADLAEEPVPSGTWPWAEATCTYVRAMVAGWTSAEPAARHPWLMGQSYRLAEAHRLGCLTRQDHAGAVEVLHGRMRHLRGVERAGEVEEAVRDAVGYVEALTEAKCRADLGDHAHERPGPTLIEESDEDRDQRRGYLDWSSFWTETPEDREYLIPGLWTVGASGSIYSPSGAGKSLLGLEWAACLALGLPLLGEPIKPRTVLYVDLENDRQLIRERLEALGLEGAHLPRLRYSLLGDWEPLDTTAGGRSLVDEARRVEADLVVIDTTARSVSGEENSADTFHALYRHTMRPLKAAGIAVLRLDHAGKDLKLAERGSSAKRSDVDLTYRLTLSGEATVLLKREKNRLHLPGPEAILLRRTADPLRHEPADVDAGREQRVAELLATLDRLGVPLDAGRPTARRALKDDGTKASDRDLNTALARRRFNGSDAALCGWGVYRPPQSAHSAPESPLRSNAQGSHSPRTGMRSRGAQPENDAVRTGFAQPTGSPETAGAPPETIGPCARCGARMRRYGPFSPGTLCEQCRAERVSS